MKSYISSFTLLIWLFTSGVHAQNLQWGFEDWDFEDNIENPIGWEVNNYVNGLDTVISRFFKDSIHVVEGNYSLSAQKDNLITSAFFNCSSSASLYQALKEPISANQSVFFSVKTEALMDVATSYAELIVGFTDGAEFLGRVEWYSYEEIVDWVDIEVPIPFEGGTAMSIQVYAASQNGALDGCNLESIVWFDNLRIMQSSTNSTEVVESSELEIFPNPATGVVYLKTDEFDKQTYRVFDIMGRLLEIGVVSGSKIKLNFGGLNVIELQSTNQSPTIVKVMNNMVNE